MSHNVVRDRDEVDGALLVPEAYGVLVSPDSYNDEHHHGDIQSADVVTAATSIPPSNNYHSVTSNDDDENKGLYNYYASTHQQQQEQQQQPNSNVLKTGIVMPNYSTACKRDDVVRVQLQQAERRGLIHADQEADDIERNQMKITAINYFQSKEINYANQIAKYKDQSSVDEQFSNRVTAAANVPISQPLSSSKNSNNKKSPEESYESTYGKGGYEVSEYTTTEYNTSSDYQTSDYKSVYDR